ncbi:MAG TPA: HAD hydrolase-like protein [Dongiaceae bacterium]|jgi:phosphoglycolate phosphatase|nr:HAD hydrolase-like protein [Dongiaceae bacterium]
MRFRLALFDFDGTLADSQDWFLGIFDEVADRFGYRRLAPGDRERLRGLETRAILRDLGIPAWKLPLIARHVRALATRDVDKIRLFPGAAEMLAAVKAGGVQVAVVSSNAEENVRRVLGPAAAHVAHFACGASLFGKEAKIRAALGATRADPRAAIFVGDEARDVAAARDAGVGSGAVAWGYAHPEFLRSLSPTLFFAGMDEIAPALTGR